MIRGLILIAAVAISSPAIAQSSVSPLNPGVTAEQLQSIEARIPQPADTTPPAEMVGGTAGAAPTFRRADAAAPRITRSGVFTVSGASGLIGGTWSMPLPAGASSYPMFFTGIGPAGSMAIDCLVISSTNTAFQAQCRQGVLTLSLLSAPISILAPSGTQVYALALPATQVSQ